MQGTHAIRTCSFVGSLALHDTARISQVCECECDIDGIGGQIGDDAVFDDDDVDDNVSHRDQIEDPHPNRDQKSVLWCFGEAR
jgi:hypothetical protein